jgi:hypothetical protein
MINQLKQFKIVQNLYKSLTVRQIKINASKLLAGSDNNINPLGFSLVSGNLLYTSTLLEKTPHCQLLNDWKSLGAQILLPDVFNKTEYRKYAMQHINIVGKFNGATDEQGVVELARRLVGLYEEIKVGRRQVPRINVRKVDYSDCYQISGGELGIAAAAFCAGHNSFKASVGRRSTQTALQQSLSNVLWFSGNRELYQPIDAPELATSWPLTRTCSDRFSKMKEFLMKFEQYRDVNHGGTYMDLGSFYGWFVHQMSLLGFDAMGIELDPIAIQVGIACYGLSPSQTLQGDISRVLEDCGPFDVTSCLSVLHHFVAGTQSVSADELIKLVDKKTRHILFFDTGQEHEGFIHGTLPGWDPDFIEQWVMERTSFKTAYRLGVDEDAKYPHHDSYGRMLFAFVK